MVYAPATQEVLLLGGAQPRRDVGTDPDAAIWIWNGHTWRTHPSRLPPRANEAVAYDPERNRLVVHGGSDLPDETWEWDHQVWRPMSASGPGARGHHAMSYDAVRKQMVLFGNNDRTPSTDTWGWNGQSWTRLASDGPPARGVYGIAFDAKRGVVVLFGGCCAQGVGLAGDTWEWNSRHWTRIQTADAPSPRFDTSMAYDPMRDRIVLFGGGVRSSSYGDTWEFDGRNWTRLDVPGPSSRNGHAMVYDPRVKAILLFGGRNATTYFNDFWAFDGTWKQITSTSSVGPPSDRDDPGRNRRP